jgi:hypothetical protein
MDEFAEDDGFDSVYMQFVATGLDRKDTLGSSDPYLVISQVRPDGSRVRVYQSPVLMNTLNPTWPAHRHYLPLLCNSDPEQPLVAEVWDWNKSEAHELIGTVASPFTLEDLIDAPETGATFPLVDPKRVGKKGYANSGVLGVKLAEPYNAPPTSEYLAGGLRFKCMVAVDFTSGNGVPSSDPSSFHYLDPRAAISNPYATTLAVLGTVMQRLNGSSPFAAYGFGAGVGPVDKKGRSASTPGVFPLSSPADAKASAVVSDSTALVDAYRAAAASVSPAATRNYVPVLEAALATVASEGPLTQRNQHYTLLALLTCGPMDDAEATVEAILRTTPAPVSVLIIGVGSDEASIETRFVRVRALDVQLAGLHTKKQMSTRDNLMFIPMPRDQPLLQTAAALASVSMTTTCDQLVAYLQGSGVDPGAGPTGPTSVLGRRTA